MSKCLRSSREDKCNGCEICVFESQRQLGKVGLEEAFIRVFRKKDGESEYPKFTLEIDPRINSLNIGKVKEMCPKDVFDTEEE